MGLRAEGIIYPLEVLAVGKINKQKRAFSLIELLLVVTILGTLAGGIYGIYDTSTHNARVNTMRAQRKALKQSIEQYFAKNDTYPPSLEALTKSYLSKIPDDPLTSYTGCDWLIKGPLPGAKWISTRTSAVTPVEGIFDVTSASGL